MTDPLLVSNALLWVLVVGLALVVLALARQIGVLHERIAPAGALSLSGGLKAGETVPPLALPSLAHGNLTLDEFARREHGVLLFFLSPTCPVCKSLLPVVQRIAREEPWLELLLASDGGEQREHRNYVNEHGLDHLPYVLSQELGLTFQVSKLPYAVLVDEAGILVAQGLVNSREHIESLLEARRLGVESINQYMSEARGSAGHDAGARSTPDGKQREVNV
jgi:methylamine dehydrogenase accessory protein MauD